MLDVIVCGLRGGQVVCAPRFDPIRYKETSYQSTAECKVLTFTDALQQAKGNPAPQFPVKWVGLGWCGNWCGLYGWMLPHTLAGDGCGGRVHLYSRMVSSNPTAATASRERAHMLEVDFSEVLLVSQCWRGRTRSTSSLG